MGRRRIRAIRRLLRGRRLPVGGKLALATLVREHCSRTSSGSGRRDWVGGWMNVSKRGRKRERERAYVCGECVCVRV